MNAIGNYSGVDCHGPRGDELNSGKVKTLQFLTLFILRADLIFWIGNDRVISKDFTLLKGHWRKELSTLGLSLLE
jgi:hypothetical protein